VCGHVTCVCWTRARQIVDASALGDEQRDADVDAKLADAPSAVTRAVLLGRRVRGAVSTVLVRLRDVSRARDQVVRGEQLIALTTSALVSAPLALPALAGALPRASPSSDVDRSRAHSGAASLYEIDAFDVRPPSPLPHFVAPAPHEARVVARDRDVSVVTA
jgi:hypothetical protein